MGDNYKTHPLYKWTRVCFWILVLAFLPTYFITRYQNEEFRYGPDFRLLNTLWFIPTHRVTWESYLMSPEQVEVFLKNEISPQKILRDTSISSINANGHYYIVFRLKTDQPRVHSARIKCYVEGTKFPIDFEVYPGANWELLWGKRRNEIKDYIVPVHIDPKKVALAPHLTVQWTHMYRE